MECNDEIDNDKGKIYDFLFSFIAVIVKKKYSPVLIEVPQLFRDSRSFL